MTSTRPISGPGLGQGHFVGRESEMEALERGLGEAGVGASSIVLIHGEAGIGKTRLIDEFARYARTQQATVMRGACYEGGAPPYGPWVAAIEQHLEGLAPGPLTELLGSGAPEIAEIVPRIKKRLVEVTAVPRLPPADGRQRLFDAVAQLLNSLAGPRVLLLDDLHWGEPGTLDMFSYLARFTTNTLIVASYRGAELDLDHPLTGRLAEAGRHRLCRYLLLSSLSSEAAAELVISVAGPDVGADALDMLYEESAGNPLFLIELARHLNGKGIRSGSAPTARLPQSVMAAIGLRLAGVPPGCRRMLETAAVFTAGIEFSVLRELTGSEEEELLDCVDFVLRANLWVSEGKEHYDFAHALVRHALYDRFSPSRRARLHRHLAEVLEQVEDSRRNQTAAELARQYHASASIPGAQRGVAHALRAAEQARDARAPEEAATFLRMALDLLPSRSDEQEAQITGDLALALAEAAIVDDACATLERAILLLRDTGAAAEQIADLIGRVISILQMAYVTDEAIDRLIAGGLDLVGDRHELAWARLKLLERRFELIPAGRSYSLRFEGLDPEAVKVARAEGNDGDFARTIDIMQWLSLPEIERLSERVEAFTDRAAKLRGLDVLAMSLALRHGAPPMTERLSNQVEDLAVAFGSAATRAMAYAYRAAILGVCGQLRASLSSFAQATAIAERIPSSQIAYGAIWMRELTAQQVGPDWAQMAQICQKISTDVDQVVWFSSGTAATAAYALVREGESGPAHETLHEILPALERHEPTDFVQSAAVGQAAAAIWELGDAELAAALLPMALALLEADAGDWYMHSNELTAARLLTVLGNGDEAIAHFDQARKRLGDLQQLPLLAVVNHDEALARRILGLSHVSLLLAQATQQFARLDMTQWQERDSRWGMSRDELPDGLTPREVDVLRLVTAGRTNKQIAADLIISVFTVERHLANAYRKINVRNRVNAAAYVVAHDL